MNIYIAHNYEAKEWLRLSIVPKLTKAGHHITSRWITDDSLEKETEQRQALADLGDIDNSDILLIFTDNHGKTPGEGKYVELGYALRAGHKIFLVGEYLENARCVFFYLNRIFKFKTIEDVISSLP